MGSRCGSVTNSFFSMWRRHCSILLLLTLAAVILSVVVLHRLEEGRVVGLVIQDRERQLLTLQTILEKEAAHSKEMRTKIEELKAKAVSLRIQKLLLRKRLSMAENLAAHLRSRIASLKDVKALTDLLKQQRGHAEETEHRPHRPSSQPINAALVHDDDLSNGTETNESTSQGEMTANYRDEDAQASGSVNKEEENSEHEQGSNSVEWVRPETNANDVHDKVQRKNIVEIKKEISEEGKHDEGIHVSDQNTVKAGDEDQINRTTALLLNGTSTMDGELEVIQEEVGASNTVAASEEGKQLENKDNNGDGEEKQTTDDAQQSFQQDTQALKDSQTASFQHDQSSKTGDNTDDDQVIGRINATGMSSGEVLQAQQAQVETSSAEAEAAEQRTRGETEG